MFLSILITHYNRSEALLKCIRAFHDLNLDASYEIVISDDGSDVVHQELITEIPNIKLVSTEKNSGLGANINRGLAQCSGQYILYCQEDFLIQPSFKLVFDDVILFLQKGQLDMVRLTANYYFPDLVSISNVISLIPKWSLKNFRYNAFQYSDNPFVVKSTFFEKNGFYLENVKGHYCETEYAIRIMKSKAKIGILKNYVFSSLGVESVLNNQRVKVNNNQKSWYKKTYKYLRAIRHHFEFLLYDHKKRRLFTYKKISHQL